MLTSPSATLLAAIWLAADPAAQAASTYTVDAARSSVVVHVGKAGLFKFAGHEHVVTARSLKGKVLAAVDDISRSTVTLSFESAALRVEEQGEPAGDAPKVQEAMLGAKVLDAPRFPAVTFESRSVRGKSPAQGVYDLEISGDLALHGQTRSVILPLRVELAGDELKASGRLVLRQSDYQIKPVSVAGVVKVKDELTIDYVIVATKAVQER